MRLSGWIVTTVGRGLWTEALKCYRVLLAIVFLVYIDTAIVSINEIQCMRVVFLFLPLSWRVKTETLWQAELTFIHNYWYQQFKLVISLFGIIDISNLNTTAGRLVRAGFRDRPMDLFTMNFVSYWQWYCQGLKVWGQGHRLEDKERTCGPRTRTTEYWQGLVNWSLSLRTTTTL